MSENPKNETQQNTKKRKKRCYFDYPKRRKRIETGLKGFLCSCNFKESECIKESYNILNEYADILYGPETLESERTSDGEIEDELLAEINKLRQGKSYRRFQLISSGAKNFLFIRTTLDNPVELVRKIVEDICDNKQQKTRYLIRLTPVETVTKAYVDDIVKALSPILEVHFKDSKKSFAVVYNHRNNSNLSRDELIKEIVKVVCNFNSENVVELKEPEISIIVEVIKGFAFLAVIPHFVKYKKFNLIKLSSDKEDQGTENENKEVTDSVK